jgi:hypothetical protein
MSRTCSRPCETLRRRPSPTRPATLLQGATLDLRLPATSPTFASRRHRQSRSIPLQPPATALRLQIPAWLVTHGPRATSAALSVVLSLAAARKTFQNEEGGGGVPSAPFVVYTSGPRLSATVADPDSQTLWAAPAVSPLPSFAKAPHRRRRSQCCLEQSVAVACVNRRGGCNGDRVRGKVG